MLVGGNDEVLDRKNGCENCCNWMILSSGGVGGASSGREAMPKD